MVWATFSPVLTGTVLLSTTIRYSLMWAAISRATPSTKLRSTLPSGWGGVGTAMKITFEAATASPMEAVKESRPALTFF